MKASDAKIGDKVSVTGADDKPVTFVVAGVGAREEGISLLDVETGWHHVASDLEVAADDKPKPAKKAAKR